MNIRTFTLYILIALASTPTIAMNAPKEKQEEVSRQYPLSIESPEEIIKSLGDRSLIILFDPNDDEKINKSLKNCELTGSLNTKLRSAIKLDGSHNKKTPIIASRTFYEDLINCKQLASSLTQWTIYKTNDNTLVIFMPGAYKQDPNEPNIIGNLKKDELISGIKISHLKPITDNKQAPTPIIDKQDLANYLKEILVTREDFKNISEEYLNRWDIYLNGHGTTTAVSQKDAVAGMSIKNFDKFLDFLNNKINTRSLLYDTCYAGAHLAIPYKYQQAEREAREKDLNYTVISTTSLSNITLTELLKENNISYATTNFASYFKDLESFFTKINTAEKGANALQNIPTLADIIKHVSSWENSYELDQPGESGRHWLQIPTVRFPHTDRFTIISAQDFNLTDSAIRHAINQKKEKMIIPEETKAILLESHYIPIPIEIKGYTMPLIIPKELDGKDYFFKKISMPNIKIIDFVMMFKMVTDKLPEVSNISGFYFDEIEIKIKKDEAAKLNENFYPENRCSFYNVRIVPGGDYNFFVSLYFGNKSKLKVIITPETGLSVMTYNNDPALYLADLDFYKKARYAAIKEFTSPDSMKDEPNNQTFEQLKNDHLRLYRWLASLENWGILDMYGKIPKPLAYDYLINPETFSSSNLSNEELSKIRLFKKWSSKLKNMDNPAKRGAFMAYLFDSNLDEWRAIHSNQDRQILDLVIGEIKKDKDLIAFAQYKELMGNPIKLIKWIASLSDEDIKHFESVIGPYKNNAAPPQE